MFNTNRHFDGLIVAQVIAQIVDQTCTFQCLIPMDYLPKYDRCGHASSSGYGP